MKLAAEDEFVEQILLWTEGLMAMNAPQPKDTIT